MARRTSRNSVFNKRSQDLVASTNQGKLEPSGFKRTDDPTSANLLPVATAQLDNTHPVVSTGGQQQGEQQQDPVYEPENTANVALERDAADYSSDHSIERFFTNIGRGAYDAGESYSTDIVGGLTGNAPIRHMKGQYVNGRIHYRCNGGGDSMIQLAKQVEE